MDCYIAHIQKGAIEEKEQMALRWLDLDQLDSVSWLPADIKILPAVRNLL